MNIFNEDYITDSYLFLNSISYFSDNNDQMFNNKYLLPYKNELLFKQIKELHNKLDKKRAKLKIVEKTKLLLGAHIFLSSEKKIETVKSNAYTGLLEDFLNQRMEEEKRLQEIEKEYK